MKMNIKAFLLVSFSYPLMSFVFVYLSGTDRILKVWIDFDFYNEF